MKKYLSRHSKKRFLTSGVFNSEKISLCTMKSTNLDKLSRDTLLLANVLDQI